MHTEPKARENTSFSIPMSMAIEKGFDMK